MNNIPYNVEQQWSRKIEDRARPNGDTAFLVPHRLVTPWTGCGLNVGSNATMQNWCAFPLALLAAAATKVASSPILTKATNLTDLQPDCSTVFTLEGTWLEEACVFPFALGGRTFHGCTSLGDADGLAWCSVETDAEGQHVSGQKRWGHCDPTTCLFPLEATKRVEEESCLTVRK